jgi:transposase-like protein/IS1 family transposase
MLEKLPKTLVGITRYFNDPLTCIEFVAFLRWANDEPVCHHCGEVGAYFLATRKIYKCKACRKQFSVKMGTIFEESAVTLDKWLIAIWLIANCKNGISSYELGKGIGVTQKTAWFMNHRIRHAMTVGSIEKLSGDIECDETYIGGDAKNMHSKERKRRVKAAGSPAHKTAVLGMVERKGKVRAKVVKSRDAATIRQFVTTHAERGSQIFTDEWRGYHNLHDAYIHEIINHTIEYVRDNVHTNSIENFWALLKRSIKGTYVSVAPEHLQAYVEEQAFRYNERKGNDKDRFVKMIESISGKRLTWNQLVGCEI